MIITTQSALEAFCASLQSCPFITVDTEFLREKTYYSKLCLIQISDPQGEARAIDTLAEGLDLSPLFGLLKNPAVLKVFHAARQDLEIFYRLMGSVPGPLFDTQIAAMVCGYGESAGYETLVRTMTGKGMDKSSQFTDWSRRPLSQKQIDYALGDVTHLVDIYKKLEIELKRAGRTEWVFEEEEILNDPRSYESPPEDAWMRIKIRSPKPKTLAVLRELAAWRERRAQEKDLPRPWVMKDDTLADMAAQAPRTKEDLARIRGVSADLANGHIGQALLEAIRRGLESDKSTWPKLDEKPYMPQEASGITDVLRMLLKIQCAEHNVAAKLVASREDLELLSIQDAPDVPAMRGWRYEIFGREAEALKRGELAIGLGKKGAIVKHRLGKTA